MQIELLYRKGKQERRKERKQEREGGRVIPATVLGPLGLQALNWLAQRLDLSGILHFWEMFVDCTDKRECAIRSQMKSHTRVCEKSLRQSGYKKLGQNIWFGAREVP